MFNPCGEFRWSLEGPVSQIHSPHLLVGAPAIFSGLFRWQRESGVRKATAPIKSLVKLHPWFLSLRWKTCLRQNWSLGFSACSEGPASGQNTDDDDDDGDEDWVLLNFEISILIVIHRLFFYDPISRDIKTTVKIRNIWFAKFSHTYQLFLYIVDFPT